MKSKLTNLGLILLTIGTVILFWTTPTNAFEPNKDFGINHKNEEFLSRNKILFYDPNKGDCYNSLSLKNSGSLSLTAEGEDYFKKNLENFKIKINQEIVNGYNKTRKELYIIAIKEYNQENNYSIPEQAWAILAVIDSKERSWSTTRTILNGIAEIGSDHIVDYHKPGDNYVSDLKVALSIIVSKAKDFDITKTPATQWTIDDIANIFLRYNRGVFYDQLNLTWKDSGYVNNLSHSYSNNGKLDHKEYCKISEKYPSIKCGHNMSSAGAIHVFQKISEIALGFGGPNGGGNCSWSVDVKSLRDVYDNYAWQESCKGKSPVSKNGSVVCNAYMARNQAYLSDPILKQYPGGNGYAGQDCGAWVRFSMIKSGLDPKYGYDGKSHSGRTDHMKKWFIDKNNGWQAVGTINDSGGNNIDSASLMPGDIALTNGHIWYYVGDGIFSSASIHYGEDGGRYPMKGHFDESDGKIVTWYRKTQ